MVFSLIKFVLKFARTMYHTLKDNVQSCQSKMNELMAIKMILESVWFTRGGGIYMGSATWLGSLSFLLVRSVLLILLVFCIFCYVLFAFVLCIVYPMLPVLVVSILSILYCQFLRNETKSMDSGHDIVDVVWQQALVSFKKYMPPPLLYFKVNICPLPLSHFASIFFTYLWSFRWPNYIVTLPRYFSFRLPHLNISSVSKVSPEQRRRVQKHKMIFKCMVMISIK